MPEDDRRDYAGRMTRKSDFATRYGGEKFVVILPGRARVRQGRSVYRADEMQCNSTQDRQQVHIIDIVGIPDGKRTP
jgi:GGDEF domain-containing protein